MPDLITQAMPKITGHYPPPRKNVVLLSCMDLRLIDQLASFMDRDNLTNRYDHLVLAGAGLGGVQTKFPTWRQTFFDHLAVAVALHQPEDVYIVEHRNCGAYRELLGLEFGDTPAEQRRELNAHRDQAAAFSREIEKWCTTQPPLGAHPLHLNVTCFLMDLRGDVQVIHSSAKKPKTRRKN